MLRLRSQSVPRDMELKQKDNKTKLSIDSTTSTHYSHDDWLKALYDVMKDPRGISRITLENVRRSLDDE